MTSNRKIVETLWAFVVEVERGEMFVEDLPADMRERFVKILTRASSQAPSDDVVERAKQILANEIGLPVESDTGLALSDRDRVFVGSAVNAIAKALSAIPSAVASDDVVERVARAISDVSDKPLTTIARAAIAAISLGGVEELGEWFNANTDLELSWGEIGNDPSECAWRIHRCNGGYNDREWTLIAHDETANGAMRKARAAIESTGK